MVKSLLQFKANADCRDEVCLLPSPALLRLHCWVMLCSAAWWLCVKHMCAQFICPGSETMTSHCLLLFVRRYSHTGGLQGMYSLVAHRLYCRYRGMYCRGAYESWLVFAPAKFSSACIRVHDTYGWRSALWSRSRQAGSEPWQTLSQPGMQSPDECMRSTTLCRANCAQPAVLSSGWADAFAYGSQWEAGRGFGGPAGMHRPSSVLQGQCGVA